MKYVLGVECRLIEQHPNSHFHSMRMCYMRTSIFWRLIINIMALPKKYCLDSVLLLWLLMLLRTILFSPIILFRFTTVPLIKDHLYLFIYHFDLTIHTHKHTVVALYKDALLIYFKNAYVFLSHLYDERFAWNPLEPLIGHENESINPKQINNSSISSKIQKLFFGVD